MVLPLILAGGAAVVAIGSAVYSALETDVVNNVQNNYQNEFVSNETVFDFSDSYFEKGSNVSLSNRTDVSQSQKSTQAQSQDNTMKLILIAGALIGAYYVYKGLKKK